METVNLSNYYDEVEEIDIKDELQDIKITLQRLQFNMKQQEKRQEKSLIEQEKMYNKMLGIEGLMQEMIHSQLEMSKNIKSLAKEGDI